MLLVAMNGSRGRSWWTRVWWVMKWECWSSQTVWLTVSAKTVKRTLSRRTITYPVVWGKPCGRKSTVTTLCSNPRLPKVTNKPWPRVSTRRWRHSWSPDWKLLASPHPYRGFGQYTKTSIKVSETPVWACHSNIRVLSKYWAFWEVTWNRSSLSKRSNFHWSGMQAWIRFPPRIGWIEQVF